MAEQGRTAMTTVEATGDKGRLTSNQFYNTSYTASYGKTVTDTVRVNFTPHLGRLSATGFTANQRPAVYYQHSLDRTDNPQFGLQLSDNFMSQTKRHYQPHIRSDSSRSLPNILNKPRESGFHQLRNHPKTETVEQKTEYQRLFVPHRLTPTAPQNRMTVGPKGETGFTEGTNLQLNTFQEKKSCTVDPRQTHNSVMKSDFMPPSFLQGTEATPSLCSHSSRETGFTRGTITPLACPELSGYLLNAPNNQAFPNTPFDCSHFTTHYKSMFCHHIDSEKLRCGRSGAGINSKMDNGYNRRDMDRFIFRG
ncbi:hypothetical protein PAMP_019824 [Pampus punctatissimus]